MPARFQVLAELSRELADLVIAEDVVAVVARRLDELLDASCVFHPGAHGAAMGAGASLSLPLRAQGKTLGAIRVTPHDLARSYTTEEVELGRELAERAAIALANAQLVAELRATAEALRKSESRYRRLADAGLMGMTVSDLDGNLHEVNDAFLKMAGYTREDFEAGMLTGASLGSGSRNRTDAAAREGLRLGGIARPWEREIVRKDGSLIPVLVGAARIDDAAREHVAVVLDLSELKRAEAASAAVMSAALDAIVIMDHHGSILDWNPAAETAFGYSREEAVGRSLADTVIPEALRAAHAAGLRRYLGGGDTRILGRRVEVTAVRRNGEQFPAEVAIVRNAAAGDPTFTGYIRDITERKRAAEAEVMRREIEAAAIANRELEAFSYSVAHDLRAPLRGISGFSGILLEDHGAALDEDAKALIERIVAGADRMAQLIDGLLSLARLSRTEIRRQSTDLSALARDIIGQLCALEPTRSVDVTIASGLRADGEPRLLRALLENLLGNAWKFTRHRAGARIEVGREGDGGPWFVRDNGAGFDMAYANKLFTPFQRLHSVTEFEGSGVGLATVDRIVRRHGGKVTVEGRVDHGVTVWFTLG